MPMLIPMLVPVAGALPVPALVPAPELKTKTVA
jgi:hypothetical protein